MREAVGVLWLHIVIPGRVTLEAESVPSVLYNSRNWGALHHNIFPNSGYRGALHYKIFPKLGYAEVQIRYAHIVCSPALFGDIFCSTPFHPHQISNASPISVTASIFPSSGC